MTQPDEKYQRMQEEHLNKFTMLGRRIAVEISAAALLLQAEFLGEEELSDVEKQKFFEDIIKGVNKYTELVDWSLAERQKYIDSLEDK